MDKEYWASYYKKNKKKIIANVRDYQKNNQNKIKSYLADYYQQNKEQMKKLARALKFNNWKVLIHPDIKTSENETKRKNKAYLDEIAKIEAEFNEK